MYRARFYTKSENGVPALTPDKWPYYWITGWSEVGEGIACIVVAYVEDKAHLKQLWPDAFNIDMGSPVSSYVFTDRFPRPERPVKDWWISYVNRKERNMLVSRDRLKDRIAFKMDVAEVASGFVKCDHLDDKAATFLVTSDKAYEIYTSIDHEVCLPGVFYRLLDGACIMVWLKGDYRASIEMTRADDLVDYSIEDGRGVAYGVRPNPNFMKLLDYLKLHFGRMSDVDK